MTNPALDAISRDARSTFHGFSNLSAAATPGALTMIQKGRGIWVYDDAGKPLLEAASGMWCASLGFGNEELAEVAYKAMRELGYYHTMAGKTVEASGELARRLLDLSPMPDGKVHFASTGSEANDFLVKLSWYANAAAGNPGKRKFITRQSGYHGATVVAASLSGMPANRTGFGLPTADFLQTLEPHHHRNALPGESEEQFCDRLIDDVRRIIAEEGAQTIAGMLIEPVSGAGGVLIAPTGYHERLQQLLAEHDIPLFCDEIITGIGRLGQMYGSAAKSLTPSAISLGKGLTGAVFPLSALIVDKRFADAIEQANDANGFYFGHGTTYSGHPVGCAIALAVLNIFERDKLLEHVRQVAKRFAQRLAQLREHPQVAHARADGLMGAVELHGVRGRDLSKEVRLAAEARHGLIFRAVANNVCAFSPPLIITESEVDELFDRFTSALDEVSRGSRIPDPA